MMWTRSPSGSAAAMSSAASADGGSRSSLQSTTRCPDAPIGNGFGNAVRPARCSASRSLAASTRTRGTPPQAATSSWRTFMLSTPASARMPSATSSVTASRLTAGPVSVTESLPARRVDTTATRSNCRRRVMYESVRRVAGSIHGKSSASTTTGPRSAASTSRSRVPRATANGSTGGLVPPSDSADRTALARAGANLPSPPRKSSSSPANPDHGSSTSLSTPLNRTIRASGRPQAIRSAASSRTASCRFPAPRQRSGRHRDRQRHARQDP